MKIVRRIIATLLILIGLLGLILSGEMFGDIAFTMALASIIGILSGIGFWLIPSK